MICHLISLHARICLFGCVDTTHHLVDHITQPLHFKGTNEHFEPNMQNIKLPKLMCQVEANLAQPCTLCDSPKMSPTNLKWQLVTILKTVECDISTTAIFPL